MGVQLWLLRHGEAEPHGTQPDEQRELTKRGEEQSRAAGAALRALGVRLDAALSSPRVRALDTARLACDALSDAIEPQLHEPLSAGFDAAEALRALERRGPNAHVLMVGHEPDLSGVVRGLTGARVDLKKGGLAMVRIDSLSTASSGPRGELILLARPRELALIAGMGAKEI